MHRIFSLISLAAVLHVVLAGLSACDDSDSFTTDAGALLSFSTDTIRFDTVITTVGSSTRRIQVYNPNDKGVRIAMVSLQKGERTPFRVNVDGTYLDVKDVTETPAGDIVRPPHSVEIVVDGGDSKEIAQQILANKAGGINTVGETVVVLPGEYDEEITIRFNRPTTIYTWFRLGITLNRSEALPPNYVDLLREVVLENMDALDAGKDVVPQQFMSQLYKACSGISYIDIQLYASADASDEKPSQYPDRSKNITARQRAYTKEEMIEVEIDG